MKPAVKIALYVILLAIGIVCAFQVKVNLANVEPRRDDDDEGGSRPAVSFTNAPLVATNDAADTNTSTDTNLVADASTNSPGAGTNAVAGKGAMPPRKGNVGRAVAFGGGAFFCLVGLALLIGRDFSKAAAERIERFVFNDDLEGVTDPEYEEAENIWKAGRHLEAVQLMRDYYKRHPSEVYVALRIAEIYEKDLRNYLASALEYEEILKQKLPDDRWGWAAIHLANLYSGKLDKPHEATRLLHRIINEFGRTVAAKKARQRLGIPEPIEEEPVAEEIPAVSAQQPAPVGQQQFQVKVVGKQVRPPASETLKPRPESPSEPAAPEEPPKPSLPPGFRPKK